MTSSFGTVFIIDDDDAVLDSLQWLLLGKGYMVKIYRSAEDFLESFDPDEQGCVVTDMRMGGMSGLDLQQELKLIDSPLPLIFITGHGDVPLAVEAMKHGAIDFIQKPFDQAALIQLIDRCLKFAQESFRLYREAIQREKLIGQLTVREHEVFNLIIEGFLNKQIAETLHISIKTVEAHRSHIMKKFRANTIADLIRMAFNNSAADIADLYYKEYKDVKIDD